MKTVWLGLAFILISTTVQAATLTTAAGNRLTWYQPVGWQAVLTPPPELLDEMAQHIEHEAKAKEKNPTQKQLQSLAKKRLAANELLLYHPTSGAWISFDFSSLHQGEDPPSAESLELSARYALESLEAEEGITHLRSEQRLQRMASPAGTRRLNAHYLRHGIKTEFNGLIGYLTGEWFFIYATSYPDKSDQRESINNLFNSFEFNP